MRISQLLERMGPRGLARAKSIRGTKGDVDPIQWLNFLVDEQQKAINEQLRERAYSKGDISIPVMPGFSISYQDSNIYVADLVCPVVPGSVERKYFIWDRRDANSLQNLELGLTSEPVEAFISVSNDTYTEKPYGQKSTIPNSLIVDAPNIKNLYKKHAGIVLGNLMRQREKRVLDLLMTSSSYASGCTSALSGTARWDVSTATSTANPVDDILGTAMCAVGLARQPNTMLIGKLAYKYLRTHPKVIAACGGRATDRKVSNQELCELFDLERIVVASAKYDAAGNASTASYSYMAPKSVALIYVQPGAQEDECSFAKTFRHHPVRFESIEDRKVGLDGATIVKATHADAEKVVASDSGYLLDTVIS